MVKNYFNTPTQMTANIQTPRQGVSVSKGVNDNGTPAWAYEANLNCFYSSKSHKMHEERRSDKLCREADNLI